MTKQKIIKYCEDTPIEEVDWRIIDTFVDNHNRWDNVNEKIRELKQYYKNLRYESK